MVFSAGKKELLLAGGLFVSGMLLVNSMIFGGLNLGTAIGLCLGILCSFFYALSKKKKVSVYSVALLVLSLALGASFARADDTTVKVALLGMVILGVNLALCLLAGKNRRNPGTAVSLLDGITTFCRGFGRIGESCLGIGEALRGSRSFGKKSRSVLLGIGIALPLLIILIPLLMTADAAFEGLMDLLPSVSVKQILMTVILGGGCSLVLYARSVSLEHSVLSPQKPAMKRGLSSLTVNTVLTAVCFVYLVYLLSQLAYFAGGFSGILPEAYTLAEYARRGFFEMAWLCALNLCMIVGALWVCIQKDPAPRYTRILCLFLGLMTLFLVCTASAKMLMYIESYGLTRLRVLTQVMMVFFGLTTLFVCLWLFARKLPYMKCVVVTALLLGALVSWADVDTVVARYNTDAYLAGKLAAVDVAYLAELGDGAVPSLAKLSRVEDQAVRDAAVSALCNWDGNTPRDFRNWNYASAAAETYLKDFQIVIEIKNQP